MSIKTSCTFDGYCEKEKRLSDFFCTGSRLQSLVSFDSLEIDKIVDGVISTTHGGAAVWRSHMLLIWDIANYFANVLHHIVKLSRLTPCPSFLLGYVLLN